MQVFMSWLWIIPAFHLPNASAADFDAQTPVTFKKDELDFPIGLGSSLISVTLFLERTNCDPDITVRIDPARPPRETGDEEESAKEHTGFNKEPRLRSERSPDTPQVLKAAPPWRRVCG